MSGIWQRSSEVKYPVKYYEFLARDKDTNELVEYTVEDIPESRYAEASRFMIKYFVPYEPKLVAKNAHNDPEVLEDLLTRYLHPLNQKVSVACFKKGCDDFVGINILEVLGRNDPPYNLNPKSKTLIDIDGAVEYILEQADMFNRYNVDYYMSGTGLAVDTSYRGIGIATEMIKARKAILEFHGLELFSTGFASIGAQKAAAKAGWTTDYSISYKELGKVNSNWSFCVTDVESYIQMSFSSRV